MDSFARAAGIYVILWLLLRVSGQRTLSEITTFDFVLLLIIAEVCDSALVGQDYSMTNAFIMIVTLIFLDVIVQQLKTKFNKASHYIEGMPLVVVQNGEPMPERLKQARVEEEDILSAARLQQGLMRMDQIKYAVIERNGSISVIPAKE